MSYEVVHVSISCILSGKLTKVFHIVVKHTNILKSLKFLPVLAIQGRFGFSRTSLASHPNTVVHTVA